MTQLTGSRGKAYVGDMEIPINRLHLDLNNPRHEPVASEAEAIQSLCDDELITELAEDIARRGALSPLEVMGVVEMDGNPGHFVSLEGNRRTCALIVLSDPKRAPAALRGQLAAVSKGARIPRRIKAHVFESAAQAKEWIELRHLGQQGGAGIKNWNPTQQQRAAGDNKKTSARANTLSVLVLDRLMARGLLSASDRAKISVTTLTRYLGTPGVRAILGLSSSRSLEYTHDADEVDVALQRLALDSITPNSSGVCPVNSRSTSTERVAYANSLKRAGIAPTTHLSKPAPPPKATRAIKESASKKARKSAPNPAKRNSLFDASFAVAHKDVVLRRLRHEAKTLDVAEHPFSATYLLRALVEHVMTMYARAHGRTPDTDAKLTTACLLLLEKSGFTGKGMSALRKASGNPATAFSLHSLGNAVHGGIVPGVLDVKGHADTWQPVLEEMLRQLDPQHQKN